MLVPEGLQGIQGQIVLDSLQAVVSAFSNFSSSGSSAEIKASTPSGQVTILKVPTLGSETGAVSSDAAWQAVEVSTEAGQMPVLLPEELLNANVGGNKMLVVTELNAAALQELPEATSTLSESTGSTKGILNSRVLDLSLASEQSGSVGLAAVTGLRQPLYFRIRESNPIEGDLCVFYDPVSRDWSSEGTRIELQVPVGVASGTSGTWCQTTHLSLFAVMQTISFDGLLPTGETAAASAGVVAIVTLIFCFCGSLIVAFLLKRRLRRPVKGQAHIRAKGGMQTFDFTRGKLVDEVTATASARQAIKKKIESFVFFCLFPPKLEAIERVESQNCHLFTL